MVMEMTTKKRYLVVPLITAASLFVVSLLLSIPSLHNAALERLVLID
jgi:H+/Cl- antiporter ClcA